MNYFEELNSINVSDKTEKKNGLTYLSWSWAWGEVKKKHPDATYTIYENEQGWNYFTDGRTGWVKTGATVNGIEHIEYLPIMDYRNKSILLEAITSFDVNKTIQRSLTKALARHGLGLYIYAGEDLPEQNIETKEDAEKLVITFGKYKGKTLKEIAETNENYMYYLLENGEEIVKKAVQLLGYKEPTNEEFEEKVMLMQELSGIMQEKDIPREKLYKKFNVNSDAELTIEQLKKAIELLNK